MPKTRAGSGQVKPNLQFQGTTGITIPVGTTAQRNATPQAGEIRYNTDLNVFEGYTGTAWGSIGPYPFATVEYFTGDGTTTEFTLSNSISNPDNLIVSMNGVILKAGQDFDLSYPDRIRFIELDGSTTNAPLDGAEIIVRGFQPITAASIPAGSIGLNELDVVDGTNGQFLRTDGAGNLSFATVTTNPTFGGSYIEGTVSNASIKENSITIRELDVSPGTLGQVLATDGAGNLSFITLSSGGGGGGASSFFELSGTIALGQIPDAYITQSKIDINGASTSGYVLSTDGTNFQWTAPAVGGATASLNNLSSVAINSSLLPANDSTIDLGSNLKKWRDLYLSGSSLYLGSAQITATGSAINLPAGSTVGGSSISALVNSFSTITVAGQSNVVADSSSDTLTLIAGAGVSLTTNATNDSITITSTATAPNLFATFTGNSGTTTANTTSDTLNIVGSGVISTSMSGDTLTISSTASGVVNSGTASRLAFYSSTGSSISETASTLSWNNSTGTLTVSNLSTTGSFTITGTITADEVITTGVGAPTITSGSDITLDAASGAGAVIVDGDLEVSGELTIAATTGTPTNTASTAGWLKVTVGASVYYLPLYQ